MERVNNPLPLPTPELCTPLFARPKSAGVEIDSPANSVMQIAFPRSAFQRHKRRDEHSSPTEFQSVPKSSVDGLERPEPVLATRRPSWSQFALEGAKKSALPAALWLGATYALEGSLRPALKQATSPLLRTLGNQIWGFEKLDRLVYASWCCTALKQTADCHRQAPTADSVTQGWRTLYHATLFDLIVYTSRGTFSGTLPSLRKDKLFHHIATLLGCLTAIWVVESGTLTPEQFHQTGLSALPGMEMMGVCNSTAYFFPQAIDKKATVLITLLPRLVLLLKAHLGTSKVWDKFPLALKIGYLALTGSFHGLDYVWGKKCMPFAKQKFLALLVAMKLAGAKST